MASVNIQFLDRLADQAAKDWLAGERDLVLDHFRTMRAEDAAYFSIAVLAQLGEALFVAGRKEKMRAFCDALAERAK